VKKKRIAPTNEGEITGPIYRRRDERDFINYRGISLLSTTYKIFPISFCQGKFRM